MSNQDFKNLVSQGAPQPTANTPTTIQGILTKYSGEIKRALPNGDLTPERMGRICLTAIKKNPKLGLVDAPALFGAVIQCAQLGLEPNDALGMIYLVPYGKSVQVQIGYRGLIELGIRSGVLKSLSAEIVYTLDEYKIIKGLSRNLIHNPMMAPPSERGDIVAVYATATLSNGDVIFYDMWIDEVREIMMKSQGYKYGGEKSIWGQHFNEMAKKTVIRRLLKYMPLATSDTRLQRAIELDNKSFNGVDQELGNIIDIDNTYPDVDVTE